MAILFVENAQTSHFSCTYPDCHGVCCHNGRPPVEEGEAERIGENLTRFIPLLRPAAQKRVSSLGFMSRRRKEGRPALAVVDGACVFFNDGCVLHIAFPLDKTPSGGWYVRQHGLHGEAWDLGCIDGHSCQNRAVDSLQGELDFLAHMTSGDEAWRFASSGSKGQV
jgi:hypothetical protein